jgi:uncharacterized protein DUF4266
MSIARTALALAALALTACASVPAYQRGYLAREDMALDANPGTLKAMERTFSAKEAASGGASVGGGGCGCN